MKDVRKEREVLYFFCLYGTYIHSNFMCSGWGDAEQGTSESKSSKPSGGVETVSPVCPFLRIEDELCGVMGL